MDRFSISRSVGVRDIDEVQSKNLSRDDVGEQEGTGRRKDVAGASGIGSGWGLGYIYRFGLQLQLRVRLSLKRRIR